MNKKALLTTSYKFYWGGIADFKGLASNLALNVSTRKCFEIPTKTYMYRLAAS
jgi:hypothetical protein